MRFLCQVHLDMYTAQSEEQLSQQWEDWMYMAGAHYENADWKQCLIFAGSAFDLARMHLKKTNQGYNHVIRQVTLAGIYLGNVFEQLAYTEEARHVRWLAGESLSLVHQKLSIADKAECNTCKRYLFDVERQACFVQHFLDLPFEVTLVSKSVAPVLH